MSPLFFFSLSFARLPPTFLFSLSFPCSIFQICLGQDNYFKLQNFRHHGYRNNFRFPFSSLLTLSLSLLCKTRVAMRFTAKLTSSCIWVAIPVDWVILHWYACGVDGRLVGRSVGRAVYGHVIAKFSRMGRFTYLWSSARALEARAWSSAISVTYHW